MLATVGCAENATDVANAVEYARCDDEQLLSITGKVHWDNRSGFREPLLTLVLLTQRIDLGQQSGITAYSQQTLLRRKSQASIVRTQLRQPMRLGQILCREQVYRCVLVECRQPLPVGRKAGSSLPGDAIRRVTQFVGRCNRPRRVRIASSVPNANLSILASTCQLVAIGNKGQCPHFVLVSTENCGILPCLGVPEPNRLVGAC